MSVYTCPDCGRPHLPNGACCELAKAMPSLPHRAPSVSVGTSREEGTAERIARLWAHCEEARAIAATGAKFRVVDVAWLLAELSSLRESLEGVKQDTKRIDWLQGMLVSPNPPTEIFFAGLRSGGSYASEFQCEVAPGGGQWHSHRGGTIREAIDAAMYPECPGCSEAGGAGAAVHHAPPLCPAPSSGAVSSSDTERENPLTPEDDAILRGLLAKHGPDALLAALPQAKGDV